MTTDGASQQFATVFRGFDPGQVEAALSAVRDSATKAREEAARAAAALETMRAEREEFKRTAAQATDRLQKLDRASSDERETLRRELAQVRAELSLRPTEEEISQNSYVHLGKRVGQILSLAEAEAASLIQKATGEADQLRAVAQEDAERTRRGAEQHATEARERADTDAAQVRLEAQESAATLVDDAVRDAAARREEAEAYFERQRAMASEAAADFERTLGQRREKATREFQAEMAAQEEELRRIIERVSTLRNEGEAERQSAAEEAAQRIADAKEQAHELLESARSQAERVRRESEREVAAAMARRDSITSQLTNVRSMLATFGLGTGVADDVFEQAGMLAAQLPATPTEEEARLEQLHAQAVEHVQSTEPAPEPEAQAAPEDEAVAEVGEAQDGQDHEDGASMDELTQRRQQQGHKPSRAGAASR